MIGRHLPQINFSDIAGIRRWRPISFKINHQYFIIGHQQAIKLSRYNLALQRAILVQIAAQSLDHLTRLEFRL